MPGHKISLSKFHKIKILKKVFSDHNRSKLKIKCKIYQGKHQIFGK